MLKLKYLFLFVALFWTGVVSYFCLIPSDEVPVVNIPNIDKCIHAFFHFVFTFVWFLFFRKQLRFNNILKPLLLSFLLSFVFGIVIELSQQFFTTTRQADFLDGVANVTGALLAVLTARICNKFNILK